MFDSHVVSEMADEAGQKKALLDQAAHENVLSDDLYSVKTTTEDTQLKGSKYVIMPNFVHNARIIASVRLYQGPHGYMPVVHVHVRMRRE